MHDSDTRRTGSLEVLIETSNNLISRDVLFPLAPLKMSSVTIYVVSRLNSHSSPPSRLTFHFIRCFFVKIQTGLSWLPCAMASFILDRNLLPGEAMVTMSRSQSAVLCCSILNGLSCEFWHSWGSLKSVGMTADLPVPGWAVTWPCNHDFVLVMYTAASMCSLHQSDPHSAEAFCTGKASANAVPEPHLPGRRHEDKRWLTWCSKGKQRSKGYS